MDYEQIRGKYDLPFDPSEPEAYRRDVLNEAYGL